VETSEHRVEELGQLSAGGGRHLDSRVRVEGVVECGRVGGRDGNGYILTGYCHSIPVPINLNFTR
jgi:hypothetical protein